jgi:hypothetical protein
MRISCPRERLAPTHDRRRPSLVLALLTLAVAVAISALTAASAQGAPSTLRIEVTGLPKNERNTAAVLRSGDLHADTRSLKAPRGFTVRRPAGRFYVGGEALRTFLRGSGYRVGDTAEPHTYVRGRRQGSNGFTARGGEVVRVEIQATALSAADEGRHEGVRVERVRQWIRMRRDRGRCQMLAATGMGSSAPPATKRSSRAAPPAPWSRQVPLT